jgi:peptidoglycan/xylan/chitin deacetylase (PgdA/CDA1 family)
VKKNNVVMKSLYNPPKIIKKIFNEFAWESAIPKVLITFDDGPNPNTTSIILKQLEKYSIKSIFFCVGENLEKSNSLVGEILSQGHEIGNHTYKHQIITKFKRETLIESIGKAQSILVNNFNYQIKYFRPPHGRFDFRTNGILRNFSLQNVMWSLLTYDYKNDINIVKFAIEKYLQNNSIIVLHDSNKSKNIISDSIEFIVDEAEKRNFQIGKPSECLKSYSS